MALTIRPSIRWPVRRGRLSRSALGENLAGYLFISPWIIGFLVFEIGPLLSAGYLSLTNYDLLGPAKFIGVQNYLRLFLGDTLFWQSLRVTAIYSVVSVALHIVVGVALALLLNQSVRGIRLYRTVFYMPTVVSGVAAAYMWLWVFNADLGIINVTLAQVSIKGPNWLFDLQWVLPTFILISLWSVGSSMLLYLGGLQGISSELYEAVAIDGAGFWSRLWHVTLPMTSPVIFFSLIIGIIYSFQVFTGAFVMTQGGPANATLFYVLNLYNNAFENFKMGYASALAMVLFAIIMLLTVLSFRVAGRWVYYEGQLR